MGTGSSERYIAAYPTDASAPIAESLSPDAALHERVEAAERAAQMWESKLRQAERQIEALERRVQQAERRAKTAEQWAAKLEARLRYPADPEPYVEPPPRVVVELSDPAGICRVCGTPAPPPHHLRKDGLRVCRKEACRKEAQRRDNNAKQRRYNARQSAKTAQ